MNVKRVGAIVLKELQDIRTNWNQLFMYALPVGIMLVYDKLLPSGELPPGTALILSLLTMVTTAGMLIPAMMIAEEKEKKTLEVLLLSPAKPGEIFLGKSLTTFLTIIACTFVLMLIDSHNWPNLPVILAATGIAAVFMILFGLITGILSKNQMATGIVGTPLMFVLFMLPTFATLGVNQLQGVAAVVPTYHYILALKTVLVDGRSAAEALPAFGILAAGIAVTAILLFWICKKKGLE